MALQAKAKAAPSFRFYALYDKVYRRDVLYHAYRCCRANQGSPGVDGQSFEDVEAYGLDRWLDALTQTLKEKTYRPDPVRRVWIPKPDGKENDPQQGRRTRHAARRSDLAVVGQLVYAAIRRRLAGVRTRTAVGRSHRQLCG
jgi:hypothetical protein